MLNDARSVVAYNHWRHASDKVDYFMLGISTALTAYFGQNLITTKIGVNPSTLELASLFLFAASVLAGLERIKAMVTALGAESGYLAAFERAGNIRTAVEKGGGANLLDSVSGETFSIAAALKEIAIQDQHCATLERQKDKWKEYAECVYKCRDRCLMCGVVLFTGAKLWLAIRA